MKKYKLIQIAIYGLACWMAWYVTNSTPKGSFVESFFGVSAAVFGGLALIVLFVLTMWELYREWHKNYEQK